MLKKFFSMLRGGDGNTLADSFERMKQQDEEMKKAGDTLVSCSKRVRQRIVSLKASPNEQQQPTAQAAK